MRVGEGEGKLERHHPHLYPFPPKEGEEAIEAASENIFILGHLYCSLNTVIKTFLEPDQKGPDTRRATNPPAEAYSGSTLERAVQAQRSRWAFFIRLLVREPDARV